MLNSVKLKKTIDKTSLMIKYSILFTWCLLIFICLGWVLLASLSTTSDIFDGKLLASGINFNNYHRAFINNKIGIYFINSIIYSSVSCIILIILWPQLHTLYREYILKLII